jgi:aldehyde dehydrogenase (NAD+)
MEVRRDVFLAGGYQTAVSTESIDVVNPATEQVIGRIPDCNDNDVVKALAAAHIALKGEEWSNLTATDRAGFLRALADALATKRDEMAELVTSQNGVAIGSSRGSVDKAIASYRYYADVAEAFRFEEFRANQGDHSIIRREPIGVAALIVPWNGPQPLLSWKLAPALVAGCTVVIKPAPETTLDAYLLMDAVRDAGFPPGVINLLPGGRETGAALVRNLDTNKVAFTGSTSAGKEIAEICARQLKPATLELGGKSAAILLDDIELSSFAPMVASVCSPNTGQVCRACTRVLVPHAKYDEAVDMIASSMSSIKVGDPTDPTTQFGPLVSARQRDRVEMFISKGIAEGATIVTGGSRPAELPVGYYLEPTVFSDVTNEMVIAREEIFGPVLVVIPYRDIDEAVSIANDSKYGLGGFVYTSDLERGTDIARRLETGSVGVNNHVMALESPFGGYKDSGIGREMGPEAVNNYIQIKSIYRSGPVPITS